jgi:hypothetical protein
LRPRQSALAAPGPAEITTSWKGGRFILPRERLLSVLAGQRVTASTQYQANSRTSGKALPSPSPQFAPVKFSLQRRPRDFLSHLRASALLSAGKTLFGSSTLSMECRKGGLASFIHLSIREIREIRGPSSGPYSGCPRTPRFQASFDSLKFRSNATSKPVMLISVSHAS